MLHHIFFLTYRQGIPIALEVGRCLDFRLSDPVGGVVDGLSVTMFLELPEFLDDTLETVLEE